jgi:hypothetical protein
MTRDEAVTLIQQGLAFRSGNVDQIIAALTKAQNDLERENVTLPWFLIQQDQTISVTASTQAYSLPTGFIKEVEDEGLRYTNSQTGKPVFLIKKPFDEAKDFYTNELEVSTNRPLAYSLRKATIYLWPVPDTSYTLTWSYYAKDTALTSNVENEWLENIPYLLIAVAGKYMSDDLHYDQGMIKFEKREAQERMRLASMIAAREESNMPRAMGRNH